MQRTNRGRVLITGAAGFAGHHMVLESIEAGFQVRATDISSRYYSALFDALGVEFIASDLTRREGLDKLCEGMDSIIHVAGIHDYSTHNKVIFAVNVNGVENICDAAVKMGIKRFMHISSVGVYGLGWFSGKPVKEDGEKLTPPLNNYNVSKWQGEKVVWKYIREKGLQATIFRPAAIYGIRSVYGIVNVFKQIYMDRKKKKMMMVGKGDKIEAFIHVEDTCGAVLYAYDHDAMIGEAYNVSDDTHIVTTEFFKMVCKTLLGEEKDFLHIPLPIIARIADISQIIARIFGTKSLFERATLNYLSCDRYWDNSKLKATGFELKYPTIENGMKETIQWYKDNGWFRSWL